MLQDVFCVTSPVRPACCYRRVLIYAYMYGVQIHVTLLCHHLWSPTLWGSQRITLHCFCCSVCQCVLCLFLGIVCAVVYHLEM